MPSSRAGRRGPAAGARRRADIPVGSRRGRPSEHRCGVAWRRTDGFAPHKARVIKRDDSDDDEEPPWLRRWRPTSEGLDACDVLCEKAATPSRRFGRHDRLDADGCWSRAGVRLLASTSPKPRLCIAMLVRGAPAPTLESFCRYHFGVGFRAIHFFFDAPADPKEAAALRACERWSKAGAVPRGNAPSTFAKKCFYGITVPRGNAPSTFAKSVSTG